VVRVRSSRPVRWEPRWKRTARSRRPLESSKLAWTWVASVFERGGLFRLRYRGESTWSTDALCSSPALCCRHWPSTWTKRMRRASCAPPACAEPAPAARVKGLARLQQHDWLKWCGRGGFSSRRRAGRA
jgi:hypothetical protein